MLCGLDRAKQNAHGKRSESLNVVSIFMLLRNLKGSWKQTDPGK